MNDIDQWIADGLRHHYITPTEAVTIHAQNIARETPCNTA